MKVYLRIIEAADLIGIRVLNGYSGCMKLNSLTDMDQIIIE